MCDRLRPHQLDFDWRFTQQTAYELSLLCAGRPTLLIGCPTVGEAMGSRSSQAVLLDRQPAVTCKFSGRFVQADVRGNPDVQLSRFDRVIFDSPWYPDDLLIWLDFALSHSKVGAEIYFTMWPDHTRPSASMEAEAIINQASLRGVVERRREVLRYETPGFEHISVDGVGNQWRSGDLVQLTVRHSEPLGVAKPRLRLSWHRFAFGDFQVALHAHDNSTSPTISPIYGSWSLPSVSRRQSGLEKIGIWTSDNRVGAVEGGKHLHRALSALARREEPSLHAEDRHAMQVLRKFSFVPARAGDRRLEWEQYD
jgi:hypothetical protein